MEKVKCNVCFRGCMIAPGEIGFCNARKNQDGRIVPLNYGKIFSIALDPIEKKPLRNFYPGSQILSIGSYGCNLRCPFCQNWRISMAGEENFQGYTIYPEKLVEMAYDMRVEGNVGIAFTYNEPLVGWEFIRDTEIRAKEKGLKTVVVSNGTANPEIIREIIQTTDAMNIDLKAFTEQYYRDIVKGDFNTVRKTIEMAASKCHLELTSLIIPGLNDSEKQMKEMCKWISGLDGGRGKKIPLHISRYFPAYNMQKEATPVERIYRLKSVAEEFLENVYTGNC